MVTIPTQTHPKFTDTYWIIRLDSNRPYGKVSFTHRDFLTFNSIFKDSRLIWAGCQPVHASMGEINMRIVDTSTAQQEKIRPKISHEIHTRLIRAREVAANIYKYLEAGETEFKPIPWLPEILDYLCKDIDVILHEIDKWELENSLSNAYLFKENDLQEPCHD